MSAVLKSLRVDLDRESKGDWVDSLNIPGARFAVSSLHMPAYQTALEIMTMRLQRKYKSAPVPPEVRVKENGKLYAEHILHGWEGLDEPYTPDLALQCLTDPAYRPLITEVINCALRLGEPDVEYLEEEEKNSDAPSAGS